MKEIKDKRMEFVLRYYQTSKLDTQKAIQKVMPAKTVPLWRKWAVAASLAAIIFGGAYAALTTQGNAEGKQEGTELLPQNQQTPSAKTTRHFHFDNTPLPEVLKELGSYYGVTLTADKTDKRLTADFDSGSLDETLHMIEQVLDVRITY